MTRVAGSGTANMDLCLALMQADTEDEVVELLREAGYWDDDSTWRYIGDNDSNWSTIGSQQSDSIPALAEKFVNSIDARLTNACLEAGIDPKGPNAPKTIREAVAQFFEGAVNPKADHVGRIANWLDDQIRKEARNLTLAATGRRGGAPSLSIADVGEGQTPDMFPETFMSILRRNKVDIPFVQGKFNMGGTGALYFCGHRKLQLVVSRRNPRLVADGANGRAKEWGFTVTRREATGARSSVYTYLAPVGAESWPRKGSILSFASDAMPLLPAATRKVRDAYSRQVEHGSLLKLYEYDFSPRSNIVFTRQGLRQKLETYLPELALPVGVFECRSFRGAEGGSYFTPARGTATRLEQEKSDEYLEFPPLGSVLRLNGDDIFVRAYAFKRRPGQKKREGFLADYAQGSGVLYTVNGQTHNRVTKEFFARQAVDLDYLKDDLLVTVDCSAVNEITREDLFMNSRDRNRVTPLWKQLEQMIERLLKKDEALQQLALRRREEAIRDRTEDNQALADLLNRVLEASPDLAKILLGGIRLPSPFPKPGTTEKQKAGRFVGKRFPTFFHFEKHRAGEEHKRRAELGRELRISFVTDAQDDYFWRTGDRGSMRVILKRLDDSAELSGTLSLRSGVARWVGELPGNVRVGDILVLDFEVADPLRDEPFQNRLRVEIVPRAERSSSGGGKTKKRANDQSGDKDAEGGLGLPEVVPVTQAQWDDFGFDERSALSVKRLPTGGFDFFYNVENESLLRAQKSEPKDAELIRERFRCSLALIGLALVQHADHHPGRNGDALAVGLEELVKTTTSAIAPVILPLVEFVRTLSAAPPD